VECGQQAAAAYIQRFTMVGSNGRNQLGFQIGRLPIQMPCRCRARPLSRAVLVLAHGPNSRPRHGHGGMRVGPCLGRARVGPSCPAHLENYKYHGQIRGHKILMATLDYFYIMIESIKL
jgi:hypothetical protein